MSGKNLIKLILLLAIVLTTNNMKAQSEYVVNPSGPYSYEQMMKDASSLAKKYPELIKVDTIGHSVEGRKIISIEMGTGQHNILVCSTFHAREYIATTYTMNFIDKFAHMVAEHESVGGFTPARLMSKVKFCIIPMLNPDGVNLVQNGFDATQYADTLSNMRFTNNVNPKYRCWKANIHGVDLNRNFDYGWETDTVKRTPASSGYKGSYPISEPETQCLVKYMELVQPEAVLAMHTQGRTFYFSTPDSISKSIAQRLKLSTHFSTERVGRPYGSFQDYVNHYYNVLYACVELCPHSGPFPYNDDNFQRIYNEAEMVLPIVADGIMSKYR